MIAENITKEKILNNTTKQKVYNGLMEGLTQEQIAKNLGLSYTWVRKLATKGHINTLVKQEQAKIGEKNEITVINRQLELIRLAKKAEEEGKLASAIRCNELLLKTIGGFQTDQVNPKNKREKADPAKIKAVNELLNELYGRKYLASEDVTVIDMSADDSLKAGSEAVESETSEDMDNTAEKTKIREKRPYDPPGGG